jgi:xylan 1,4-beta-xylosidase
VIEVSAQFADFPLVSGFKRVTMNRTNNCNPARSISFLLLLLLSLATVSRRTLAQNPILPGDHPDPTVVRIGNTFWTTSTSGNWAPEFPLYRSNDLRHWTAAGAVFPRTPEWASGSFWAPEMVFDRGRVLVYYVGRKRDGPLCVAVATATRAQGPYIDHGPILCQPDGSIDPSLVRDEHGQPFLIWKEDGNSEGKLTPIWAQPLTSDLLHLTGSKTKLIVNDPASWEGGVVEGPYIFRHAGRFYLFYAGNACCGSACKYAEGVARADRLFGPWEKDPANPIIRPNAAWRCPGHGTAVKTPSGKDYFLYHAYPATGTVYLGRESVIDAIDWNPDGWPTINAGQGPSGGMSGDMAAAPKPFLDDFRQLVLDPEWKWPIGRAPTFHVGDGRLLLEASADGVPECFARSPLAAAYVATVGVNTNGGAESGLGLIGNGEKGLVLLADGKRLELSRVTGKTRVALWQTEIDSAAVVWLRVSFDGNGEATFNYSLDQKQWTTAKAAVNLASLLQWDQGLRVGLVNGGPAGTRASFVHFSVDAGK